MAHHPDHLAYRPAAPEVPAFQPHAVPQSQHTDPRRKQLDAELDVILEETIEAKEALKAYAKEFLGAVKRSTAMLQDDAARDL